MRLTQRELQDLDFWISEQGQRYSSLVVVWDKMYSQVVTAWDSCASSSRQVNHDREVIQIVLEFQGCSYRWTSNFAAFIIKETKLWGFTWTSTEPIKFFYRWEWEQLWRLWGKTIRKSLALRWRLCEVDPQGALFGFPVFSTVGIF